MIRTFIEVKKIVVWSTEPKTF